MKTFKILFLLLLFLPPTLFATTPSNSYPTDSKLYEVLPYSVLIYQGVTENNPLIHVLTFNDLDRWPEAITSLEAMYALSKENVISKIFSPLVDIVQIAGNLTYRYGDHQHNIVEVNPYLAFRWANLPWNNYVTTSLAIGEGISYASSVPAIEADGNHHTKRLLNYLMLEATFALPEYPYLQLVARVHHRSGAYGLYHAGNSGSNVIGVGIRWLFN